MSHTYPNEMRLRMPHAVGLVLAGLLLLVLGLRVVPDRTWRDVAVNCTSTAFVAEGADYLSRGDGRTGVVSCSFPVQAGEAQELSMALRSRTDGPAVIRVSAAAGGANLLEPTLHIAHEGGLQTVRWRLAPAVTGMAVAHVAEAADTALQVGNVRVRRVSGVLGASALALTIAGLALLAGVALRSGVGVVAWRGLLGGVRQASSFADHHRIAAAAVMLLAVMVLLLVRSATLGGPVVITDEMQYRLLAAVGGDVDMLAVKGVNRLPNYLYYLVYGSFADSPRAAAASFRMLNGVFYAAAGVPMLLLARRYLPWRLALAATLLVLLLPVHIHTSHQMPESFYFFGFWVSIFAVSRATARDGTPWHGAAAGAALAMLCLIKPHGLTVVVAVNLCFLLLVLSRRGERGPLALRWSASVLFFLVVRALVDLRPESAQSAAALGSYAAIAKNMLSALGAETVRNLLVAAYSNVGSLLLLFAPCVVAVLAWLGVRRQAGVAAPGEAEADDDLGRLVLLIAALLLCLLGGTIFFTAQIAVVVKWESALRIHQRYYDFTFGLLLTAGMAAARAAVARPGLRPRRGFYLLIAAVLFGAAWYGLRGFQVLGASIIDAPTLYALQYGQGFSGNVAMAALVLAAAVTWRAPLLGMRLHWVLLLLLALAGGSTVWQQLGPQRSADAGDRLGLGVGNMMDAEALARGHVVAAEDRVLAWYWIPYHALDRVQVLMVSAGSIAPETTTGPDDDWLVTVGDVAVPAGWVQVLALPDGGRLYRPLRALQAVPAATAPVPGG